MLESSPGSERGRNDGQAPAGAPTDSGNCGAYSLCMSLWLKTGDSSLLERVVKRSRYLSMERSSTGWANPWNTFISFEADR